MIAYDYIVMPLALYKMRRFYKNVARKYRHTNSYEDWERNVHVAVFGIYGIERTLLRRKPILSRWKDYYMAHYRQWYYAYRIDGDTIVVVDACHAQNMIY